MILYAESSAVLAWLVGQDAGRSVRDELSQASLVLVSELTGVECRRAISRWVALGQVSEEGAAAWRFRLARSAARWTVVAIAGQVLDRAVMPFPAEPVRTLDAIHIATALVVRVVQPDLAMLSLDARVRRNADALGFAVLPAADEIG